MIKNNATRLFATTFFSVGKVASTVGSNFFGLDKLYGRLGVDGDNLYFILAKYLGAFSGGCVIGLTRVPAIYKQVSKERTLLLSSQKEGRHIVARGMSFSLGALGLVAALNAGISAFLGGEVLGKHFSISDNRALMAIGYYTFSCATLSFLCYSVIQVINNGYQLGLWLFGEKPTSTFKQEKKALSLTLLMTAVCVLNSASMFYFSSKYGLPLFIEQTTPWRLSNSANKITAGCLVIPSEATYIFSQISAVKRYFAEHTSIRTDLRHRKVPAHQLALPFFVATLATLTQALGYYVFMRESLEDLGWSDRYGSRIFSALSGVSAGFIYYVFSASPAIISFTNISMQLCASQREDSKPLLSPTN